MNSKQRRKKKKRMAKGRFIQNMINAEDSNAECLRCKHSTNRYGSLCIDCRNELENVWKKVYCKLRKEKFGKLYDKKRESTKPVESVPTLFFFE